MSAYPWDSRGSCSGSHSDWICLHKHCDKFSGTSPSSKPLYITPLYGTLAKMCLMLGVCCCFSTQMNQSGGKRPAGFKEPPRQGFVADSTWAEPGLAKTSQKRGLVSSLSSPDSEDIRLGDCTCQENHILCFPEPLVFSDSWLCSQYLQQNRWYCRGSMRSLSPINHELPDWLQRTPQSFAMFSKEDRMVQNNAHGSP